MRQEHFSKLKQEPPTSEETTQPLLKKQKHILTGWACSDWSADPRLWPRQPLSFARWKTLLQQLSSSPASSPRHVGRPWRPSDAPPSKCLPANPVKNRTIQIKITHFHNLHKKRKCERNRSRLCNRRTTEPREEPEGGAMLLFCYRLKLL